LGKKEKKKINMRREGKRILTVALMMEGKGKGKVTPSQARLWPKGG